VPPELLDVVHPMHSRMSILNIGNQILPSIKSRHHKHQSTAFNQRHSISSGTIQVDVLKVFYPTLRPGTDKFDIFGDEGRPADARQHRILKDLPKFPPQPAPVAFGDLMNHLEEFQQRAPSELRSFAAE